MVFDVGVRESKQKAAYFRVHDSLLSKFVLGEQLKGFIVFSVIPLVPLHDGSRYIKSMRLSLGTIEG